VKFEHVFIVETKEKKTCTTRNDHGNNLQGNISPEKWHQRKKFLLQ
jgi:hypothetical protein